MLETLYALAFILSIIMLFALVVVGRKQNITYYLLVFCAIMISNMGYYSIASAKTLETAILGNRLTYLGGVFTPILMMICIMKLCHFKISRILMSVLSVYSIIVLYFAYSVEYRNDYYKSIALGSDGGVSYLIKEYGPMHSIYSIYIFACVVITLGVIIYSFFKNKRVSYKTVLWLFVAEMITTICYGLTNILDTNFELTSIAYIISEFILLILIRKIGMYEVSESIANALKEHSDYGYLIFDNKKRYVGCNDIFKKYVPEIIDIKIDSVIDEKNTFLYENFYKPMNNHNGESSSQMLEKEGKLFKCSVKDLYYGRKEKVVGYLIELIDDTQQQKYIKLLNDYNDNLEKEVKEKTAHIEKMQDKMILGMADMIENRDSNTGGHIKRTSKVIELFADELNKHSREYGFTEEFLKYVVKAAPMHDLGKIAVDDKILRKPGKFTPEEFEEMKKHAAKGADIVEQVLYGVEDEVFLRIAKNVAHYHHEKWNGEGYPEHLSGTDIPLEARIMALADVFDALVSKRCYKEKLEYDKAFGIMEESLGSHFDPQLGELFLKCKNKLVEFYDSLE